MKLKVSIYQQQYSGAPLTDIDSPIIFDVEDGVNPFPTITRAIVTLLRNNISQLPSQEVAEMVERSGIQNVLELNELNAYLSKYASLKLVVANTLSDVIPELNDGEFTIMVLTPMNSMFKMRTDYVTNEQDFSIQGIVGDIVAKFGLGRGLVPVNDLTNLVNVMNDMSEKGLPMTDIFQNTLVNQLAEYGCEIFFIYQ